MLDVFTGFLIDAAHRQADLAAFVHAEALHPNLVAFIGNVGDLRGAADLKFGDVHQTVAARHEIHEGAEIHDLDDLAAVDLARLRLGDDGLDPVDGLLTGFGIDRRDLDRPVVFDIDLGTGDFADLADDLATGPDDFADLVLVDLESDDARGVLRNAFAARRDRLRHFAEDVQTALLRLGDGRAHDVFGDGRDLDVHLQRGDAFLGSGNLEVHVAQVIFVTQDVRQDRNAVVFLDQAHGDTGAGLRQRDTRIHQRHRGAADGGHGGGPVGFGDLGDHADRVGEVFLGRHDRVQRAPGQLAMADFAAARGTHAARFTDRVGREVVVQHEVLTGFAVQRVDDLLVLTGAQRGHDQRLGFTAGEQGRTVGARQDADFTDDRADLIGLAAVDAFAGLQDVAANDVLFQVLEQLCRQRDVQLFGLDLRQGLGLGGGNRFNAVLLLLNRIGGTQRIHRDFAQTGVDRGNVRIRRRQFERLFRRRFRQIDDQVDHRLDFAMREHDGFQHGFFRQLLGFGFDHQDAFLGAGNDEIQAAVFLDLGHGRVGDQFTVDIADTDAADRAHERGAGDRQRRRGADHGDHVRIVLQIVAQHRADDLNFVLEAGHEQRADRTVDQARGQRFLFRRTGFAFEEAARDLAGRVGLFLIVDRQREKVLTGLLRLREGHGAQNGGLAIGGEHRAVGLAGDLTRFQRQGAAAPFHRFFVDFEHVEIVSFSFQSHTTIPGPCPRSFGGCSYGMHRMP